MQEPKPTNLAKETPRSSLNKSLIAMTVANTVFVQPAYPATINVGTACTLNEAIVSANNDNAGGNGCADGAGADTIILPGNTRITFSSGFNNGNPFTATPFITSDVTIVGNGNNRIYRSTAAVPDFRLFAVTDNGRLTLDSVTVGNGKLSYSGGAIYVSANSSLTVIDSRITSSRAVDANGGGIYSRGGPITLTRTTVINNSANFGGGIAGREASLNINDSDVRNNSAAVGGGIQSILGGQIIITNNSKVRVNTANVGAGINDTGTTDTLISDSSVSQNTAAQRGGGLVLSGSSRIRNSQISGNTAPSGAGIMSFRGGIIENSTISGNITLSGNTGYDLCKDDRPAGYVPWPGYGGGILVLGNVPTLRETNITNNQADCGGGIAIVNPQGQRASLSTSTVSNNSAWQGGGMFITSPSLNVASTISLDQGTFTENYARFGAGIQLRNSNVTIQNLTAHNNSAGFSGGGIHMSRSRAARQPTTLKMANVTLSNNTSGFYGGGFFAVSQNRERNSSIEASNLTIVGNSVTQTSDGAGIGTTISSLSLHNSIVANTEGSDCFDFNNALALDIDASNILSTGTCANTAMAVDPMLSPLSDNGGTNLTHALMRNSPALDAGLESVCASDLVGNLDQAGKLRPIGDNCDIGAFESPFGQTTNFFVIPLKDGNSVVLPL